MFTSYKQSFAIGCVLANASLTQALEVSAKLQSDAETAISLPYLNADPNSVTMSGYSAGAFFTHKMAFIFSGTVKGAGCAKGGAFMHRSKSSITDAIGFIDDLASGEEPDIDPTENIANNAAYIISGGLDPTDPVVPPKE